jgi:Holliday junction resolvasome RuvABC endonuclease subunit
MNSYVLGIDPGASGALALVELSTKHIVKVWDMPHTQRVLTTGKKLKEVDIEKLIEIISEVYDFSFKGPVEVHIEKVQAFGKQSAPAAFNFGKAAGIVEALCHAFNFKVTLIPPQTWKRQYNLQASKKDQARQLVLNLFPETNDILKYKKDVDRADAILIAFYMK